MIKIEITQSTTHGVRVDVTGDLDNRSSDAAFVARGMVIYAGALFVGGRPVLLDGAAKTPSCRCGESKFVVEQTIDSPLPLKRCVACGVARL